MTLSSDALTTIVAMEEALGISSAAEDDYITRLIEVASSRIKRYCNRTFSFGDEIEEFVRTGGSNNIVVSRRPVVTITSVEYDDASVASDNYKCVGYDKLENAGIIYNPGGWYWPVAQLANIARDKYPGSEDPLYKVTYDGGWVTPEQSREGSVTEIADAGGGDVTVTSALHRLSNGDSVVHTEFADSNYNGTFTVSGVTTDTYVITATWGATGTGTWTINGYTRTLPYDLEQACIDYVVLKYTKKGVTPGVKSEKLLSWGASYETPGSDDPFGDLPASIKGVLNPYRTMVIA